MSAWDDTAKNLVQFAGAGTAGYVIWKGTTKAVTFFSALQRMVAKIDEQTNGRLDERFRVSDAKLDDLRADVADVKADVTLLKQHALIDPSPLPPPPPKSRRKTSTQGATK